MTDNLRAAVLAVRAELGPVQAKVARGWSGYAVACGLEEASHIDGCVGSVTGSEPATIIVGPAAQVLHHARTTCAEFGFITPVAQQARRWQRATSWRDDTTLALWAGGWTPLVVHRVMVASPKAHVEFAVGVARRTIRRVRS